MHMPTKSQQVAIKSTIANFEKDGRTDYTRMAMALHTDLSAKPDNDFVWACINKIETTKVTVDSSWL